MRVARLISALSYLAEAADDRLRRSARSRSSGTPDAAYHRELQRTGGTDPAIDILLDWYSLLRNYKNTVRRHVRDYREMGEYWPEWWLDSWSNAQKTAMHYHDSLARDSNARRGKWLRKGHMRVVLKDMDTILRYLRNSDALARIADEAEQLRSAWQELFEIRRSM